MEYNLHSESTSTGILRRMRWLIPVMLLAAVDILLRRQIASTWTALEWGLYALSLGYVYCWLVIFRQLGLWVSPGFRRWRSAFLLMAATVSALMYVIHIVHFSYFGVHPTVVNLSYLLVEPAESWLIVEEVITPLSLGMLALAVVFFWVLWRISTGGRRRPLGILRMSGVILIIVLFTPLLHQNVGMSPGNVLPSVNLVFSSTKAIETYQDGNGPVRRLQVGNRLAIPGRPEKLPVNVLLIITESLRAASTGFGGYGRGTTPRQDRFFARYPERTFRFSRFYSNSTTTSESVPSLMTGVFPGGDFRTLHRMPLIYEYGESFSDTRSFLLSAHAYNVANYRFFFNSPSLDRLYYQEISGQPAFNSIGMDDRHVVEAFDREIAALQADQRFFGVLHFNGNHFPYNVPPAFEQWGTAERKDRYDNSVLYQDHNIGRVLERLEASGRLAQTVVLVTSDHGEGFMEHGINGHRNSFYEEIVNIPFWMHLPAELAQTHRANLIGNQDKPASNLDLVPTVTDLLGLKEDAATAELLEGLSGVSLLRPLPPGRTIIVQNGDPRTLNYQGFLVIQDSLRFLHHRVRGQLRTMVFDLESDPMQRDNLWGRLEPEVLARLSRLLDGYGQIRKFATPLLAAGSQDSAERPAR